MWLKLAFVALYLILSFILARLVDIAVRTCDLKPFSLLPTHLFVDPIHLGIGQLKKLLDRRGVNYAGVLEKQELCDLVQASGQCSQEELDELDLDDEHLEGDKEAADLKSASLITRFTCVQHLYELVEDTKDGAWVILVKPSGGGGQQSKLEERVWRNVVRKAARFGLRSGFLDCSRDPATCRKRDWTSPKLYLALPRNGVRAKEDVVFMPYFIRTNNSMNGILKWLREQLATRVSKLNPSSGEEVDLRDGLHLVLWTSLTTPPLIFSALAIKYSGRVKLSIIDDGREQRNSNLYIYSGGKRIYEYGLSPGEKFGFDSLDTFLATVEPEMNDVFLSSLVLLNLGIALQMFWIKCSKSWKHLIYWFMQFIKFNCILFLVWLTILALSLHKIPLMGRTTKLATAVSRWISLSRIGALLRYDLQKYYSKLYFQLLAFGAVGLLLAVCRKRRPDDQDDDLLFRDWAVRESTILSYILFRPMALNLRPATSSSIDVNLEEGMELLIERLAVPNLWLQPRLISNDYIKHLPLWSRSGKDQDQDQGQDEHGGECTICLEAYKINESLCELPCGHEYHENCIKSWLYTDNHCCPICRWPSYKRKPKLT